MQRTLYLSNYFGTKWIFWHLLGTRAMNCMHLCLWKTLSQDCPHGEIRHLSAYTINCVCHSIRSMFRVLGIYNFEESMKVIVTCHGYPRHFVNEKLSVQFREIEIPGQYRSNSIIWNNKIVRKHAKKELSHPDLHKC